MYVGVCIIHMYVCMKDACCLPFMAQDHSFLHIYECMCVHTCMHTCMHTCIHTIYHYDTFMYLSSLAATLARNILSSPSILAQTQALFLEGTLVTASQQRAADGMQDPWCVPVMVHVTPGSPCRVDFLPCSCCHHVLHRHTPEGPERDQGHGHGKFNQRYIEAPTPSLVSGGRLLNTSSPNPKISQYINA
jgi:hypothetical protein